MGTQITAPWHPHKLPRPDKTRNLVSIRKHDQPLPPRQQGSLSAPPHICRMPFPMYQRFLHSSTDCSLSPPASPFGSPRTCASPCHPPSPTVCRIQRPLSRSL